MKTLRLVMIVIGIILTVFFASFLVAGQVLAYGTTEEMLSTQIQKDNNSSVPVVLNETIHYRGHDYTISLKSWNGMIKDFGFDKERHVISWSVPFDLNSTRLQEIIGRASSNQSEPTVVLRQDVTVPNVFPVLGMPSSEYETPVGALNGFFQFTNSSFIQGRSSEGKTVFHYLLQGRQTLEASELLLGRGVATSFVTFSLSLPISELSPLEQSKLGNTINVKCHDDLELVFKWEDGLPACVTHTTRQKLDERGWTWSATAAHPIRIMAKITTQGHGGPAGWNPTNIFYVTMRSASTAYLLGYDICDNGFCAKKSFTPLNPIDDAPNSLGWMGISDEFNSKWKVGDVVHIKLLVSTSMDNKTAKVLDLGNSTIVP